MKETRLSCRKSPYVKNKPGFTLIEMLVFLFIFVLITVTFYTVWSVGVKQIILAKNRLLANSLATEKMEIIRNLSFEDIAHTSTNPPGNLNQNEDVVRSGRTFSVLTQIKNEDDPFDGKCDEVDTSDCAAPIDYKYVKITISWGEGSETYNLATSARFVPSGMEQPATGRGVLVINVSSDKAEGAFVNQSNVRIKNTDLGIDEIHSTDGLGRLVMVGLLESIKKYEITLEKTGYETVSTFAPYSDGGLYDPPVHEHTSVVSGAVNTVNIFQNELADLTVKTVDYLGNGIADINYHIKGGRKLGLDPNSDPVGAEVYGVDIDGETGSGGEKKYEDTSPGNYEFTLDSSETGYEIIEAIPENPSPVDPGSDTTLTIKLADKNFTSLLVSVTTLVDSESIPVLGASVRLENGAGYDKTQLATERGVVYFPVAPDTESLLAGTYNLTISADGYNENISQVEIIANSLKTEAVSLTLAE